MPETRRAWSARFDLDTNGWAVRVTGGGRIEVAGAEAPLQEASNDVAPVAEPVSAEEQALIEANRAKLAASKTHRHGTDLDVPALLRATP